MVGGRRNGQGAVQAVCRGSGHGASPWPRRVVRRNSGAVPNEGQPLPPRLPSEALANVSVAGLRTLQVQPYSPDFPVPCGTSVILGFRTCLPLRGSSGFSPDSLLILLAEKPWRKPLYLVLLTSASTFLVDTLLKWQIVDLRTQRSTERNKSKASHKASRR